MNLLFKRLKHISIICLTLLLLVLTGCELEPGGKVVSSVTVENLPNVAVLGELDITEGRIVIAYEGSTVQDYAPITTSMISAEDLAKLSTLGTHSIVVKYLTYQATYSVTILDASAENYEMIIRSAMLRVNIPVEATTNFTLPIKVNDVTVSWTSSSTYLVVNGETAIVTRPSENTGNASVTLTGTFTYQNMSLVLTKNVTIVKESIIPVEKTCTEDPTQAKCKTPEPTELVFSYKGNYYNSIDFTKTGMALKQDLRTLLTTTHTNVLSYDDLRGTTEKNKAESLRATDEMLDGSGKILLFYTRAAGVSEWNGGHTWNREHVWPKSQGWFSTSGAGADAHHIRPTDEKVNSTRGNSPFGEVKNGNLVYTSTYNNSISSNCYTDGVYFEPQDAAKGDVARIIFYLLVRYRDSDSYSITAVAQSMDLLLNWNDLDPVDDWEIARNNKTAAIQGNRNPFIDCPNLADVIFG